VQHFERYHEHAFRTAHLVVPILINLARNGEIISYGNLIENTSANRSWIGKSLYLVDEVLNRHFIPNINYLVVLKGTQLPSAECNIDNVKLKRLRETCKSLNWDEIGPRLMNELNQLSTEYGH
jgi:hypothetical protein